MPNLCLMVGIPGSGKSTTIKKMMPIDNTVVISRDAIRFTMISSQHDYFSREQEVVEKYIKEINIALDAGKNVIADATHISIHSRRKVMTRSHADTFTAIFMDTDLPYCLANNENRKDLEKVPRVAIYNMYEKLQPPTYNEGFSKIFIMKDGKFSEMEKN